MTAPHIRRRHFLQTSMMAGAAALAAGLPALAAPAAGNSADVIIIGGGVAGLTAALQLRRLGRSAILLEARERSGGRIWTHRGSPGLVADLGAQWVTDAAVNPVADLLKHRKVPLDRAHLRDKTFYGLDAQRMGRFEGDAHLAQFIAILAVAVSYWQDRIKRGLPDISVRQGLDYVLKQLPPMTKAEQQEFDFFVGFVIETPTGAPADRMSMSHAVAFIRDAAASLLVPGGYDQLTDLLVSHADVRNGTVVQQVAYDAAGVRVTTDQGEFTGQTALVTVPVGVLRAGGVDFSPALPQPKLDAMGRLGMGLVDKYWFKFPKAFWYDDADLIGLMDKSNERWIAWANVHRYTGEPVLVAFNRLDYARQLEQASDQKVVDDAMQALGRVYGAKAVQPEAMVRSSWGSDPFARGAVSYVTKGASVADRAALGAPVANRVFFAGEATSVEHAATVFGAYASGKTAAGQIESALGA